MRDKCEDRVRFITTFDPRLPPIPAILAKNWRTMIERDPRLAAAFPKPPQACYRRGPNLTSLLIKARLPQQHMVATRANTGTGEVGMRGCGRNGRRQMCRLCPHLGPAADQSVVISEAVISNNNEVIKIKDNINCTTSSVLYLITCKKRCCAMQ